MRQDPAIRFAHALPSWRTARRLILASVILLLAACSSAPHRREATFKDSHSSLADLPARAPSTASTGTANDVLFRAIALVGTPYRWGGNTPAGGFDCSGLVAYAGRQIGLNFPRTARQQQRSGVPVARNALEPGDLVFMRLRGRQHHVGIMIDAIHFVHAPSSGGRVRIDSVDEKPYATRILAGRRPDFPP